MNEVSLSIQGPEVNSMDVTEKLQVSLTKLLIRKKRAETDKLANFQLMEEVLYKDGAEIKYSLSISLKK
jgi:hypothetical protein